MVECSGRSMALDWREALALQRVLSNCGPTALMFAGRTTAARPQHRAPQPPA